MDTYIHLRFYHQGEFQTNRYVGGNETDVQAVELDRFSYTVLMEYVKDDLKYSEIGGVYVSKGKQGGWRLLENDKDLSAFTVGVKDGDYLHFYVDNVIDNNIKSIKQMQPHVIVRPRHDLFAGIYIFSSIFLVVMCFYSYLVLAFYVTLLVLVIVSYD